MSKLLRLEVLKSKMLAGMKLKMSLADNKTRVLWQQFMPGRKGLKNRVDENLYSMQVYDSSSDFTNPDPHISFTKWAAVEVISFEELPPDMAHYELKGGLYAIFLHKGLPQDFPKTFHYIMQDWLPSSGYAIDHREHFELLKENYSPLDPEAEEEIWIPVKPSVSGF